MLTRTLNRTRKPLKALLLSYLVFSFKFLSAGIIGVFLAIVGQALMDYSFFSFMFIFLTVFFSFWTLVRKLTVLFILLVDLTFVLLVFLIQLYISVAGSG